MSNKFNPRQSLNGAFLKANTAREAIDRFKLQAAKLLNSIQSNESEEFHKNSLSDFLKETYYKGKHYINVKDKKDLVIHNDKTANSSVGVIIEVKRPSNKPEMVSCDNLNKKALQELVLYYLRERFIHKNLHIKHLIITNINEWFIFDARVFGSCFAENKDLVKTFTEFENKTLDKNKTESFYKEIAEPAIELCKENLEFTYFNLAGYQSLLENTDKEKDNQLIPLFKVLSPEHLLKLSFSNDANSLNQEFYNELLHIIGLEEIKEAGKKLIKRKAKERHSASFLEQSITNIKNQGEITQEQPLFDAAIELSITWINRILFLKLLEAQLMTYHKNDKLYQFFNIEKLTCFADLNHLFFDVLAIKEESRDEDAKKYLSHIPYLNSSLFEETELERKTLDISKLRRLILPILSTTVLKNEQGHKLTGELDILTYLFIFLDAYDFANDSKEEIKEHNKSLISASVLGLIFEKINGYKDGSFFTPSIITMYMSRETIRLAVLQKFNEIKGLECQTFDDIKSTIKINTKESRKEANNIINSIKVCDPAVGSGHFLVSILNEFIAIKSELGILTYHGDENYVSIRKWQITVENDELKIVNATDDKVYFEYYIESKESQRVQKTLFHEKQKIIENCLFGVDINPNSVKICRLRLWIELLKNAYYGDDNKLETLPNIDINIQVGNSLISRFSLDADLKSALKRSNVNIDDYKKAFHTYQNAKSKPEKKEMERLIKSIKDNFYAEAYENDPNKKLLTEKIATKYALSNASLIEETEKEKLAKEKTLQKIEFEITRLTNEIENFRNNPLYKNAFEWRFEFPEALNDDGDFIGFDVIIGNPPYIKEYTNKSAFDVIRTLVYYQGKMDLWYFFACLSVDLLKEKTGILNFIATNNWTTNSGASKLRNKIIKNTEFKQLIDFSSYMIFESADIQTMIMMVINDKTKDNYRLDYRKIKSEQVSLNDIQDILNNIKTESNDFLQPIITKNNFADKTITFSNNQVDVILEKIQKKSNFQLNSKTEVAQGIVPNPDVVNAKNIKNIPEFKVEQEKIKVGDGVFIIPFGYFNWIPKSEHKYIKPIYEPYLVDKYFCGNFDKQIIYITKKNYKDDAPNLIKHLTKYKEIMVERRENTQGKLDFNHLHWSRDESFFKKGEKILCVRKCAIPTFAYTEKAAYVMMSFNIIKSNRINLKYLTAFLNSKLIAFWLKNKGKIQGNNYQIDKEPLLEIPIYKLSELEQQPIIKLVDKILTAKKVGQNTHDLETQIDTLVYALYDLTDDEIKIIEENK